VRDPVLCEGAQDCIEEDCGAQYSGPEQIPFCKIEAPSRWPPLYDMVDALELDEEVSEGLPASAAQGSSEPNTAPDSYQAVTFLYTSKDSAFAETAMQRFVRQPNLTKLEEPRNAAALQVQTPRRHCPHYNYVRCTTTAVL
jgi:hypothetical protein